MARSENVFPSTARPIIGAGQRRASVSGVASYTTEPLIGPDDGSSEPVRHASGYADFADHLRAIGEDPLRLSGDLASLVAVLQASPTLRSDAGLRHSAAIFLGNTVVRLHPDTRWQSPTIEEPEVGNRYRSMPVDGVLDRLLEGDAALAGQFIEMVDDWPDESKDIPQVFRDPVDLAETVSPYVRPPIEFPVVRDADGSVIPYGSRWEAGPPDDSYSVDSHPERFMPLPAVAEALIEYLDREFNVTVSRDVTFGADLLHKQNDVVDAIRVTPADSTAATLTFVVTAYPGVILHAGALHDFPFPTCGCDACDDSAHDLADQLENTVLSIVAGGYAEQYRAGKEPWVSHTLTSIDGLGRSSGSGMATSASPERWEQGAALLLAVPNGWSPWPARKR
ncbi:MAG: hypothetical protein JWQ43_1366 [Glaciihabitans sp.]|nr:hypothetical protein [Glaciihabitans sp.]